MKFKKFVPFFALSVLLLVTACSARTVIPEEVLQIPEFSPVYTSCNLWYDAQGMIRSENIQKGTILPFGSEVEFMECTAEEIRFRRSADRKVFCIRYEREAHLLPVEEFIKRVFVLRNEKDLVMGIRPIVREKIKRGIVDKGMTRQEVLLAFGSPAAARTPSETADTWTFWVDEGVTKKVVFFNNRVIDIIQLD